MNWWKYGDFIIDILRKLFNFVATNGHDYSNTEHQKEPYPH